LRVRGRFGPDPCFCFLFSVSRLLFLPPREKVSFSRFFRLTGRALLLRCPRCARGGGGTLFRNWWSLESQCPHCGFVLDRGEPDFWIGGYAVNLVLAEFLVTLVLLAIVIVTIPAIPWKFIQYGGAAMAVLFPLLCFPVSRLLWLAWDYCFRPVRD
jgi:uncharacterized protein (DUF983 family)